MKVFVSSVSGPVISFIPYTIAVQIESQGDERALEETLDGLVLYPSTTERHRVLYEMAKVIRDRRLNPGSQQE